MSICKCDMCEGKDDGLQEEILLDNNWTDRPEYDEDGMPSE